MLSPSFSHMSISLIRIYIYAAYFRAAEAIGYSICIILMMVSSSRNYGFHAVIYIGPVNKNRTNSDAAGFACKLISKHEPHSARSAPNRFAGHHFFPNIVMPHRLFIYTFDSMMKFNTGQNDVEPLIQALTGARGRFYMR